MSHSVKNSIKNPWFFYSFLIMFSSHSYGLFCDMFVTCDFVLYVNSSHSYFIFYLSREAQHLGEYSMAHSLYKARGIVLKQPHSLGLP